MIAQGFKPVGWVAAVASAALGCYMLSLNVAAERAELAKIERQIIAAKQDIRTLQTELGTRGRMQQLEHWNAEVLALSAPTSAQFLDNELTLARFEKRDPTVADAKLRLASADAPVVQAKRPPVELAAAKQLTPSDYAQAAERSQASTPTVRHASLVIGEAKTPPIIKAAAALPAAGEPSTAKPNSKKAEKSAAKSVDTGAEQKKDGPKKAQKEPQAKAAPLKPKAKGQATQKSGAGA